MVVSSVLGIFSSGNYTAKLLATGVAGGVLHCENLGEVLSLCQNFQERLSLSNNCTALVIKCEETQVGRVEMVIQRFLGFLGR